MNIELKQIEYEDKSILRQMMELYLHDYSEFDGEDVNLHGRYEYKYIDQYWAEEGRVPFFIRVDGQLAGLALTRITEDDGGVRSLAEYFIMRKYRRKGVGATAARQLFDMFPGRWHVGQEWCNKPARQFWMRVVDDYTHGTFTRTETEKGPDLMFVTPENPTTKSTKDTKG